MEEASGGRMHYMFNRVGGLKEDLPGRLARPGRARRRRRPPPAARPRDAASSATRSCAARTRGVGVLSPRDDRGVRRLGPDRPRVRRRLRPAPRRALPRLRRAVRPRRPGPGRHPHRGRLPGPARGAAGADPRHPRPRRGLPRRAAPRCRRARSTSGCPRSCACPRATLYTATENPLGLQRLLPGLARRQDAVAAEAALGVVQQRRGARSRCCRATSSPTWSRSSARCSSSSATSTSSRRPRAPGPVRRPSARSRCCSTSRWRRRSSQDLPPHADSSRIASTPTTAAVTVPSLRTDIASGTTSSAASASATGRCERGLIIGRSPSAVRGRPRGRGRARRRCRSRPAHRLHEQAGRDHQRAARRTPPASAAWPRAPRPRRRRAAGRGLRGVPAGDQRAGEGRRLGQHQRAHRAQRAQRAGGLTAQEPADRQPGAVDADRHEHDQHRPPHEAPGRRVTGADPQAQPDPGQRRSSALPRAGQRQGDAASVPHHVGLQSGPGRTPCGRAAPARSATGDHAVTDAQHRVGVDAAPRLEDERALVRARVRQEQVGVVATARAGVPGTPYWMRSRSSVLAPQRVSRTRPCSASISCSGAAGSTAPAGSGPAARR